MIRSAAHIQNTMSQRTYLGYQHLSAADKVLCLEICLCLLCVA